MGVRVDLADGRTGQGVFRGKAVAAHPDSGAAVSGRVLPFWSEALAYASPRPRAPCP